MRPFSHLAGEPISCAILGRLFHSEVLSACTKITYAFGRKFINSIFVAFPLNMLDMPRSRALIDLRLYGL
jgi:hypothetical protein